MSYEFIFAHPALMLCLLVLLSVSLMYLLRRQACALLLRFSRLLHRQCRLLAKGCQRAEQRLRRRNYEVTKALVEQLVQRRVERCTGQIESMVEKDLAYYKKMSAGVATQLDTIQRDYNDSAELPPPAPEWIDAVTAVAELEQREGLSDVKLKILSDMHDTIKQHQQQAMREHRWTVSSRHKLLAGLRPQWQKLTRFMQRVDRKTDALGSKLKQLDQHMSHYEMQAAGDGQEMMASVSVRFVTASFFIAVALMAGLFNARLLLVPMAELLAGQQLIAGLPMAWGAVALHSVMMLLAAAVLFESLHITRLLPLTAAMTQGGRKLLIAAASIMLILLFSLSAIWAGQLLEPVAGAAPLLSGSQLTLSLFAVAASLVMSLLVIPLEYFLYCLRPVSSSLLQLFFQGANFCLRMVGSVCIDAGKIAVLCYELLIFIPLWVEREWLGRRADAVAGEPVVEVTSASVSFEHSPEDAASNVTPFTVPSRSTKPNQRQP